MNAKIMEDNPNWKGGITLMSGYRYYRIPDHPESVRGRVSEQRIIVYNAIGKPLPPKAEIHHVDLNRSNNQNTNLVVCENRAYHHLLHVRKRVLDAGGNPSTDKICAHCKKIKLKTDFCKSLGRGDGLDNKCRDCKNSIGTSEHVRQQRRKQYQEKIGKQTRSCDYPKTRRSRCGGY
jgi:hypothetical protein